MASWLRPRSYWSVVIYHLPLALISGVVLLLPYLVELNRLPLIPCTFLHLTGYPCPFCGFTRSFWAIANGQWPFALNNCPLAFLVFLFVVVMFIWHFSALLFGVILSRESLLQPGPQHRRKIVILVFFLFLLNWIYRLVMGLT